MMDSIPLTLVPADRGAKGTRDELFTAYGVSVGDPEFSVEEFPPNLAFGLYRMEIETPDASSIQPETHLLVERGEGWEPLRVTLEPQVDRMDLYFVLVGDAARLKLSLSLGGSSQLRVGAVRLKRVSTTRWRTDRGLRGIRRRLARPSVLGSDLAAGWKGYRTGGFVELRRRILDVVNPVTWPADVDLDRRIGRFARRISAQNEAALDAIGPADAPGPSLSIIVPVYRTPEEWLVRLVRSLNLQTDEDFEVVFVFDGPQAELAAFAERAMTGGYRRRLVTLPENKGVSAASNVGIRAATGDFVIVVDHDDVLERHLVEAFHRASAAMAADIYFADEAITDKDMNVVQSVATRGRFDIRYYLSHPYIVHPIFVRRALAEEAGLFDERLRVSHDVEFFLRCAARAKSVVQIPLVLYFWRTHSGSLGHAARSDVAENTRAAVRAFLQATTDWPSFEVLDGCNFNELDVRPPVAEGARVAIVIPTRNGRDILSVCLSSIYERRRANTVAADIHVIDHLSDDRGTLAYLAAEQAAGRIEVTRYDGAWNYAAINNAALARILPGRGYTHIVFMNNDIELVTDDWLDRMIAQFSWKDVGVVGCCLEYPDGRVQHGGVVVGLSGPAEHSHKFESMMIGDTGIRAPGHLSSLVATRDFSAVTAALMAVPVPVFQAVGGFDEQLAVGFNDTDLCLRIGALGFHSTYVGGVVAIHYESITRGDMDASPHPDDTRLFKARYDEMIRLGDPYYGMQLDWSSSRVRLATEPSKAFRLRPGELPAPM